MNFKLRSIQKTDNPALAQILRNSLKEHNADKPGTAFFDDSTDMLFEYFTSNEKAYYQVAVDENGEVLGGGGLYPSTGLAPDTIELVKMYLSPQARGLGVGKALIMACEEKARQMGFKNVYLESLPELATAIKIYEYMGYEYLESRGSNNCHFACNIWMIKKL